MISPKLVWFSADTLHRHRFLDLTELQRHGERQVGADLEDDAGLHVGAESLQHRLEPVRSDRRFCSTYDPVSSVTAVRASPVSVCVTVTVTPGTARPA